MLPYGSANSAAEYWRHSQVPRKAVAGSFLPCSYLTERKAWMTKGQGCKEINSRDSMKKIFGELCRNAIIQPQRMCKNEHIQPRLGYRALVTKAKFISSCVHSNPATFFSCSTLRARTYTVPILY